MASVYDMILNIIDRGDSNSLKRLLDNNTIDISYNEYELFRKAVMSHHQPIILLFLIKIDISDPDIIKILDKHINIFVNLLNKPNVAEYICKTSILNTLAELGMQNIFDAVLKIKSADPGRDNNALVREACRSYRFEIVESLAHDLRVDFTAGRNEAIFNAVCGRRFSLVKFLLENTNCDPSYLNNRCIKYLYERNLLPGCDYWHEMTKLLLSDKRVNPNSISIETFHKAKESDIDSLLLSKNTQSETLVNNKSEVLTNNKIETADGFESTRNTDIIRLFSYFMIIKSKTMSGFPKEDAYLLESNFMGKFGKITEQDIKMVYDHITKT